MANKKKKALPKLEDFKPRNEHLHEVLLSRPAGRMKDDTDVPRSKEKEKLRKNWQDFE